MPVDIKEQEINRLGMVIGPGMEPAFSKFYVRSLRQFYGIHWIQRNY